jgi:cation:H+ antiporter
MATDDPVDASRTIVYKEAQFYMIAVSTLLITFALGVIYYPASGTELSGHLTRPLALVPLVLYGLYVFIQSQDTAEHDAGEETGAVDVRRQWGTLLAGLVIILFAVHFLVESVGTFGEAFGVPGFVMGVTVLAGATSLPDSLVSVRAARDGRGVASLANVLGSNTFDLLVAIPLGVLIVGREEAVIDFAMAVPMFGVLTAATILLFTALRTDLRLTNHEAYALLGSYGLFVGWVVAEATGWIGGVLPA